MNHLEPTTGLATMLAFTPGNPHGPASPPCEPNSSLKCTCLVIPPSSPHHAFQLNSTNARSHQPSGSPRSASRHSSIQTAKQSQKCAIWAINADYTGRRNESEAWEANRRNKANVKIRNIQRLYQIYPEGQYSGAPGSSRWSGPAGQPEGIGEWILYDPTTHPRSVVRDTGHAGYETNPIPKKVIPNALLQTTYNGIAAPDAAVALPRRSSGRSRVPCERPSRRGVLGSYRRRNRSGGSAPGAAV
jgi:hypothetical protein